MTHFGHCRPILTCCSSAFSAAIAMASPAHGRQHVPIGHKIARRILGDPGSRACGSSTCRNLDLSSNEAQAFQTSLAFVSKEIGSKGRCFCDAYDEHDIVADPQMPA